MGSVEKRGKNSWRISTQVKIAGRWQWVRATLHMDPDLPEDTQRRDALRELKKLEARLAGELDETPTLRQWADEWLTRHLDPDASPVTVSNYRYLLDSRILPVLGDLPLPDLTPARLTDWLHNLRKDPRKTTRLPDEKLKRPRRQAEAAALAKPSAKPLSVKTALLYYGCMKTMLAAAVRLGKLEYNPMDRVQRPKKRKKKTVSLPEDEIITLLQLILTEADPPLRLAVFLAMLCSLRLGEVGALQYSAVNWDAGTITVSRALKYTPATGAFIAETKTEAGDRVITLPPTMLRILREAMWNDVMEAQDDPDAWRGDRYIVHSRHGARVSKDTPSKWFRKFADAHGFQGVTFHDLRHIHASFLLQHNIDLQSVSVRMGHADPSVTLRVYADALPARDREAAAAMDRLLISSGALPDPPADLPADPDPS